jgi:predicted  nucleic acid-binding Zn-ribbon protein
MTLPAVTQLLIIQDRDRKLRQLKVELKNAPLERKALETRLAGASASLDAAKLKAKEIEVKRKELENEVGARSERILKYEQQKLATKKNDEYQAFDHAIESLKKEIAGIEDKELEFMEAAETQKPIIAAADKEATATRALVQRQIADIEARIKAIETQQVEVQAERAKLAAEVEEDLLDTYQRLFDKKDGVAVAALANEICQGCHVKAQTHIIHAVKAAKEVTTCLNCGRILYLET